MTSEERQYLKEEVNKRSRIRARNEARLTGLRYEKNDPRSSRVDQGMCNAITKKTNRRCLRQARPGSLYCEKHEFNQHS